MSSAVAFWPSGCTAVTSVPVRSRHRGWCVAAQGSGSLPAGAGGEPGELGALPGLSGRWAVGAGDAVQDTWPVSLLVLARWPAVCALAAGPRGTFDMITRAQSALTQAGGGWGRLCVLAGFGGRSPASTNAGLGGVPLFISWFAHSQCPGRGTGRCPALPSRSCPAQVASGRASTDVPPPTGRRARAAIRR